MALNPRAEIRSRMLVAILVRLAERMVQLERCGQRREGQQAQPQKQDQWQYEKTRLHHLRQLRL